MSEAVIKVENLTRRFGDFVQGLCAGHGCRLEKSSRGPSERLRQEPFRADNDLTGTMSRRTPDA